MALSHAVGKVPMTRKKPSKYLLVVRGLNH